MQEKHGLARQEAGESVAVRKGRKYKEAVGSYPLQGIDIVVAIASAKLQFVVAVNPAQRTGIVKGVLIRVARSSDGIADRGVAAYLDERRSKGCIETWLVLKTQVHRGLMIDALAKEKFVAQIRKTSHADDCR